MLYFLGWSPDPVYRMYPSPLCLITAFAHLSCLMNLESHRAGFIYIRVYHGCIQKASRQSRINRFQSTEAESLDSDKQMFVALCGSGTSWWAGARGDIFTCVQKGQNLSHVVFLTSFQREHKTWSFMFILSMKKWGLVRKNPITDGLQVLAGHSFNLSYESPLQSRAKSVVTSLHSRSILEASVMLNFHCQID